jgi:hypothetical protein
MEASPEKPGRGLTRDRLLILALVLAVRLPFLNQAIQGDDVYYLGGAQHAQIDPLHPNHYRYVFLGDEVDMRGHPHPPLNAWILGGLLAALGDVREVPFHAAYIAFSAAAALAMYSLARRFSPRPLWAVALFVVTPAFLINGNSLEADLPLLAFWMMGTAAVIRGGWWGAAPLALCALAGFQSVFLTPILWLYAWIYERRSRRVWLLALVPPLALAVWQIFERLATGALPAAVLSGHFARYGFQSFDNKLRNVLMLAIHLGWIIFPPLWAGVWKPSRHRLFLAGWIAIFFAGAVAVFFAGSARYVLPVAAPAAMLASRLSAPWLAAGFAVYLPLGLALATVNYQHWDGYRRFAKEIREHVETRRVWINAEWGLRYYLETDGGLPLRKGQAVRAGEMVVSSELAYPVPFATGGVTMTPLAARTIAPALALRLIGLTARSGYSTHTKGFLPFDMSNAPIDHVRAELAVERPPALSYLPMNSPEAPGQIIGGMYALEDGRWRWTAGRAQILLKAPERPGAVSASFAIPAAAPARTIVLELDGREIARRTYERPGVYTLEAPPARAGANTAVLTLLVDATFSAPGDHRTLGVILTGAGFR